MNREPNNMRPTVNFRGEVINTFHLEILEDDFRTVAYGKLKKCLSCGLTICIPYGHHDHIGFPHCDPICSAAWTRYENHFEICRRFRE